MPTYYICVHLGFRFFGKEWLSSEPVALLFLLLFLKLRHLGGKYLNLWISEINEQVGLFLQSYLGEINSVKMDKKDQLQLVSLAFKAIEADNRIEYAEVKFFKKYEQGYLSAMK